jgi:arylsulfatase A-like enzyme
MKGSPTLQFLSKLTVGLWGIFALAFAHAANQPNILVIWGDDVGWQNVSAYGMGTMGYTTPNIDAIGMQGIRFTDHYAQPSCTAGRAAFITGQYPIRSGMTTVGQPGSPLGLQAASPSLAEVLKKAGYRTGQFGKNHLGDRNEHLPTAHGFDEFFGNLYHLNTQEEAAARLPGVRTGLLGQPRGVREEVRHARGPALRRHRQGRPHYGSAIREGGPSIASPIPVP